MEVKEVVQVKSKSCCRVLVVGAGLGGLAAAIGIKKSGHDVMVLERMPELREVCTCSCTSISGPIAHDQRTRSALAYRYRQTPPRSSRSGAYWRTSSHAPYNLVTS